MKKIIIFTLFVLTSCEVGVNSKVVWPECYERKDVIIPVHQNDNFTTVEK